MPSQLSLADFNRIASGTYNAGQIDIATAKDGSQSLVKVNNHVWHTSRNNVQLSPGHVLAVKETFIAALQNAGVQPRQIAAIREELGMPAGLDATDDGAGVGTLVEKRFTPLTREKVRTILDTYANGGRGFTDQSRAAVSEKENKASWNTAFADAKTIARRDAASATAPTTSGNPVARQNLQDALSFVFATKLSDIGAAGRSDDELQAAFTEFFIKGLMSLLGDRREFTFLGTAAKFVPGDDGSVSVAFGSGPLKTTVKVADSEKAFLDMLLNRALTESQTLGASTMRLLLTRAANGDFQNQVQPDDPKSWERQFAAKILAHNAPRNAAGVPAFRAEDLIDGSAYDTSDLSELARLALDGEEGRTAVRDTMDVVSFLSGGKALADIPAARRRPSELPNEFRKLFSESYELSQGHADRSKPFTFCGRAVKLVSGGDGTVSVVLGKGQYPITAKLGVTAQALMDRLTRNAASETGTLGSAVVEEVLTKALSVPAHASNDRTGSYDVTTLILIAQQGASESLDSMDELAFLLGERTLTDINAARGQRSGRDPGAEATKLRNTFTSLFSRALQLLPADAKESDTFTLCGCPAKIVKGDDLKLSIVFVMPSKTGRFNLGVDARAFADRLVTCAVDEAETLGGPLMKELLAAALESDGADLVSSADQSSLARLFSAKVLADCARHAAPGVPAATVDKLVSGGHNTGILAQYAQQVIDGKGGDALVAMDELMFLSGEKTLAEVNAACVRRDGGEPGEATGTLGSGFKELLLKTLQLPPAGAAESDTFTFCGCPAKIVRSAEDGNLSVRLGDPVVETVGLGVDAPALVNQLVASALDGSVTLDAATTKEILTAVAKSEETDGISPAAPSSLARQLSMKVIAACVQRAAPDAPAFTIGEFSSRDRYGTNVLVQIAQMSLDGEDDKALGMLDALSFFYGEKKLADINAARGGRVEKDADEEAGKLRNGLKELFAKALQLPPGGATESVPFTFWGAPAKIVRGEDGSLSVGLGDPTATTVGRGADVERFVGLLIDRALDASETLGAPAMKDMLTLVVNRDVANRISYNDHVSLTRQFAANILAGYAKRDAAGTPAFTANALVSGNYQTMVLAHIAQKALEGEKAEDFNTLESLSRMHEALKQDSAGLSKEMKDLLTPVKDLPFITSAKGSFVMEVLLPEASKVPAPPAVTDTAAIARAAGNRSLNGPNGIGGIAGIKDFIADLIFSDETMVADVTPRLPGETMREILSDEKKLFALAHIIANRSVIDAAVSPKIADVVKKGFAQLIDVLDNAFKAANGGETLAAAAQKDGFVTRFAEFFMDPNRLPAAGLKQFDDIILAMSTEGCEKLQAHVNEVFNVVANEAGMVASDPYKRKNARTIAAELRDKTLNQILDAAATSDAPGQIGLFRQVISTYFTQLRPADKRSAFAASLRYAETFESGETEKARNAFTGAVLKGSGPILQKMMQGLPKEMMGPYASVLDDMRTHLAPIPRKVVQAYMVEMLKELNKQYADGKSKIRPTSIKVISSLGAASVGEAFKCQFNYREDGKRIEQWKDCVVKIMRHDAEARVDEEEKIFSAAAAKIPGMAKTWEGQFRQYKTEFDFRTEAQNVQAGVALYDAKGNETHVLHDMCPNVSSMKLSPLVTPKKNVMVAEYIAGDNTVDGYFKQTIDSIRRAAFPVFEQDSSTGRLLWRDGAPDPVTGAPVKVPVFRQDVSAAAVANLSRSLMDKYENLQLASRWIQQVTKAWFYQALLGNGEFHGDLHAGNLMISTIHGFVSLIDFGNLYKLEDKSPNGPNEKTELVRVILGAAFRKPQFILKGFENLMSPDGKAALARREIREKAEVILGEVLAKGSFSPNIVYRLQAAIVELQKLGLELPPPINCFILSLARLSNTVTEINTITNQCRALLDAVGTIRPAPARDELDLIGRDFDRYIRVLTDPLTDTDEETREAEKDARILATLRDMNRDVYGEKLAEKLEEKPKDVSALAKRRFMKGGDYYEKVVDRLKKAGADASDEAEKLVKLISQYRTGDPDPKDPRPSAPLHDKIFKEFDGVGDFRKKWNAASTPEEQDAVIQAFAQTFASTERELHVAVVTDLMGAYKAKSGELRVLHTPPPDSFAKSLMDLIEGNFEVFGEPLDKKAQEELKSALITEMGYSLLEFEEKARARAKVGAGRAIFGAVKSFFTSDTEVEKIAQAGADILHEDLQVDVRKMPGDTGYQMELGI